MGLTAITLEDRDEPYSIEALSDAQLAEELGEARAVVEEIKDSVHYEEVAYCWGLIYLKRLVTNLDIIDSIAAEQQRRIDAHEGRGQSE